MTMRDYCFGNVRVHILKTLAVGHAGSHKSPNKHLEYSTVQYECSRPQSQFVLRRICLSLCGSCGASQQIAMMLSLRRFLVATLQRHPQFITRPIQIIPCDLANCEAEIRDTNVL